jgi:hypothetical protein
MAATSRRFPAKLGQDLTAKGLIHRPVLDPLGNVSVTVRPLTRVYHLTPEERRAVLEYLKTL